MTGQPTGWGTLGSSMDPRFLQNTQQMMAQKLMDSGPAPTANSSTESAATNTLSQGLRGAMMPSMMEAARTGQTPDWMKWIGNQFSGGGAPTTGMGVGAGVGGLY
jgi:hypothetical protein